MIIRARTFKQWMKANLSDYMEDIAGHGADQGFPGITYYSDTCKLYSKFKQEIWEMLLEDAESFGHDNPFELLATFGGADQVGSVVQFENLMVWYAAERIAREEAGGW